MLLLSPSYKVNPFMHNVWPFYNIMHERVKSLHEIVNLMVKPFHGLKTIQRFSIHSFFLKLYTLNCFSYFSSIKRKMYGTVILFVEKSSQGFALITNMCKLKLELRRGTKVCKTFILKK